MTRCRIAGNVGYTGQNATAVMGTDNLLPNAHKTIRRRVASAVGRYAHLRAENERLVEDKNGCMPQTTATWRNTVACKVRTFRSTDGQNA